MVFKNVYGCQFLSGARRAEDEFGYVGATGSRDPPVGVQPTIYTTKAECVLVSRGITSRGRTFIRGHVAFPLFLVLAKTCNRKPEMYAALCMQEHFMPQPETVLLVIECVTINVNSALTPSVPWPSAVNIKPRNLNLGRHAADTV